mmetsp:Transcript_9114/g.16821  ORF Transcript_9114/g.16821 Transcript_9114/m.16821 type:complete len:375 (-) Transcript_9114:338-1462(-)
MRACLAMATAACWMGSVAAVANNLNAYLQKSWELSTILPRPQGPDMCWYAGVDVEICAHKKRENLQRVGGRIPDGVLAGYTQAGSTFLWDLMRQHPGIYESCKHHREYHYLDIGISRFNVENMTQARATNVRSVPLHLGEYMNCLDPLDDRLAINYNPRLIYADPGVPATLYAINPEAKIVLLIRSPTARIVSRMSSAPGQYTCRKLLGDENICFGRDLDIYIKTMLNHIAQKKACDGSNTIANPLLVYKCTFNKRYTMVKNAETILSSLVGNHVQHWLNIFPLDQILFLRSEDLFANPTETVNRVFAFYGLQPLQVTLEVNHNSHVARTSSPEEAPLEMSETATALLKDYLCESYRHLYNLTRIRWDDWDCFI